MICTSFALSKTLQKIFLHGCFLALFCIKAGAALEDPSIKWKRGVISPENLSALKGPAQFKGQVDHLKTLNIPFEHVAIPLTPYFGPRFPDSSFSKFPESMIHNPNYPYITFHKGAFSFTTESWSSRTSFLPLIKGDTYEFHICFSKFVTVREVTKKTVHIPAEPPRKGGPLFSRARDVEEEVVSFHIQVQPLSPQGDFLLRRHEPFRSFGKEALDGSTKITSNPFVSLQHPTPKSTFTISLGRTADLMPDCVELLIHPRIQEFFTRDLLRENQVLKEDSASLRAQLAEVTTQLRTLTAKAAADRPPEPAVPKRRSFQQLVLPQESREDSITSALSHFRAAQEAAASHPDSVTNTTVSSLRSSQDSTPTPPEEDA